MKSKKELSAKQCADLLVVLRTRFEGNMCQHTGVTWAKVQRKVGKGLEANGEKPWSLHEAAVGAF